MKRIWLLFEAMRRSLILRSIGMALGIVFLMVFFQKTGALRVLDRSWTDGLMRVQAAKTVWSDKAVLVLIDDESLRVMGEKYQQRWPWSRDAFAGLLAAIYQAGAKEIAVDLLFLEPSEDAYSDELLGSYAAACENVFLASKDGQLPVVWKNSSDAALKYRIGHVDYRSDEDGIVRRYMIPGSLVRAVKPVKIEKLDTIRLKWYGGLQDMPKNLKFSAAPLVLEGYGAQGIISQVKKSGADELNSKSVRETLKKLPQKDFGGALKNKIVFLGTNATAIADIKAMPIGRHEPGVLAHYTAWLNLENHEFIRVVPALAGVDISIIFAWLLAFIYLLFAWENGFRMTILGGATLIILWLGISLITFFRGWSIETATPAAVFLICAMTAGIHHWLGEYRARREVQKIFGSYVSPQVLEMIQKNPESLCLGGQKCEATIFFSDLQGFTDLSEKMSPEKLVPLMNDYLTEMSDFIIDHGGYLDKYIGDAIMGVFGAPVSIENHALAACRAALDTQKKMNELNKRFSREYGLQLKVRIGINSGSIIVGNMGSHRKLNYTAIGDAVNLASRLEGANKEFSTLILLGEETRRIAGEEIETRPVELLRVKGKQLPVQTYELMGLRGEISRELAEFSKIYEEAYQLYREKNFKDALEKFQRAHKLMPDDRLCAIYQERCQNFIQQPPPPDWDGVNILHSK